jgi:hypothetical protein
MLFFKNVSTRQTTHKKSWFFYLSKWQNYKFKSKLNKDHKTLYVFKCKYQMIHNKQSYIKSIILERIWWGSSLERIHKKKLKDYLLKANAQKKDT